MTLATVTVIDEGELVLEGGREERAEERASDAY